MAAKKRGKTRYKNGKLRKTFSFHGQRYYVYGDDELELLQNEIKKRDELEKGAEKIYNPSLDEYHDHFTEIRRSEIKESTLRTQCSQYRVISDVRIGSIRFGNMKIKEITRRNIEQARGELLKAGQTPQNLNNLFAHLNHIFNNATIDGTIERNPCKALKPLRREDKPISETKHRALNSKEIEIFFEAAGQRHSYYYNAFEMMIKCGIRIGELAALYPTDIDRKRGFIHIRRTITRNENGGYEVGNDAKTSSGIRDIPLTDELSEIIDRQKDLNMAMFGDNAGGLLFRSVEGNILREYSINREIKRICNATGIEVFTCHCFRNSFATMFIEQRPQDYKILSEILGHADIRISLNLYTHARTERKIEAMQDVRIKTHREDEAETDSDNVVGL